MGRVGFPIGFFTRLTNSRLCLLAATTTTAQPPSRARAPTAEIECLQSLPRRTGDHALWERPQVRGCVAVSGRHPCLEIEGVLQPISELRAEFFFMTS